MHQELLGQVLRRMGKLSGIDIDEILVEQAVARRRFGEIAISLGLCDPQHVCDAWCFQLENSLEQIDLSALGAEPHAVEILPAEMARRLKAIPIRMVGNQIILATSRPVDSAEITELTRTLGKDIHFVMVPPSQLEAALDLCYPKDGGAELAA